MAKKSIILGKDLTTIVIKLISTVLYVFMHSRSVFPKTSLLKTFKANEKFKALRENKEC